MPQATAAQAALVEALSKCPYTAAMATDAFADTSVLASAGRYAAILSAIVLPALGWLLRRAQAERADITAAISAIDRSLNIVRDHVIETNGSIKLIQQMQQTQAAILADHEVRMRELERKPD